MIPLALMSAYSVIGLALLCGLAAYMVRMARHERSTDFWIATIAAVGAALFYGCIAALMILGIV